MNPTKIERSVVVYYQIVMTKTPRIDLFIF